MNYTVFSGYTIGQSHVKADMGCEDFADHYVDPEGRYVISVICDGHSDPKCFRSAKGAGLGCNAAIKILKNLFEVYCEERKEDAPERFFSKKEETMTRLKADILQEWNRTVREDLQRNPIEEEEYASLDTPQYRDAMRYYQSGKGLNNIYGATLLAAAACEDFHLALQIGDGIVVRLEGDGIYTVPLEDDDKNEIEGPASLCDFDLLSRKKGFRMDIFPGRPQAMFAVSDGVGDTPITAGLKETFFLFHKGLAEHGDVEVQEGVLGLNAEQQKWPNEFLSYYSKRGAQDDCSLSGFADLTLPVAEVRLSQEEIDRMYRELEKERQRRTERYEEIRNRLLAAQKKNENEIGDLQMQIEELKRNISSLEAKLGEKKDMAKGRLLTVRM